MSADSCKTSARTCRLRWLLGAALIAGGWPASAAAERVMLNVVGTITAATCTVIGGANQIVDMGEIEASIFNGIGASSTAKEFAIKLDCGSVSQLRIEMTMGSSADADPDDGELFKLADGGGAATGIALEVLDGAAALHPGATVKWSPADIEDAAAGRLFSARYKQTKKRVVPGAAYARILLDIVYK